MYGMKGTRTAKRFSIALVPSSARSIHGGKFINVIAAVLTKRLSRIKKRALKPS
jgi:hypothetical protein